MFTILSFLHSWPTRQIILRNTILMEDLFERQFSGFLEICCNFLRLYYPIIFLFLCHPLKTEFLVTQASLKLIMCPCTFRTLTLTTCAGTTDTCHHTFFFVRVARIEARIACVLDRHPTYQLSYAASSSPTLQCLPCYALFVIFPWFQDMLSSKSCSVAKGKAKGTAPVSPQ